MLEKDIEQYLVKKVNALGGLAPKLVTVVGKGFPDRTVILKDRIMFVEIKTPQGRLSKMQIKWLDDLRNLNMEAHVIRSKEDVDRIIC